MLTLERTNQTQSDRFTKLVFLFFTKHRQSLRSLIAKAKTYNHSRKNQAIFLEENRNLGEKMTTGNKRVRYYSNQLLYP